MTKGTTFAEPTADGKLLNKMIAASAAWHKDGEHMLAVTMASVVLHATKFGNVDVATRHLVAHGADEKGGKSKTYIRVNEMRTWFVANGPFTWDTDTKVFKLNKDKQAKLKVELDKDFKALAKRLMENRFWESKPEPEFKDFVFLDELEKLIKRGTSRLAKIEADPTLKGKAKTDTEGIEIAKQIIAANGKVKVVPAVTVH
jgi:hypothetical protein